MLFSSRKEEFVLVLDISSGSVGGAFFLKRPYAPPFVVESVRAVLPLREELDTARRTADMLRAVDETCRQLQRSIARRPDKIVCLLTTPWAYGHVRSIAYQAEEFSVTEKRIRTLVDAEMDRFRSEWQNLSEIIDKRVIKVSLNGYTIERPHGKRARTLDIDIFASLSDGRLIARLEETIHKTFKAKIALMSRTAADFIAVRDMFELQNDFIILRVGEDTSEVSVMRDDCLVGTAFFPFGTQGVARSVAAALGISTTRAASLLATYRLGLLDEDHATRFIDALEHIGIDWLRELAGILVRLVPDRHIPHAVFVVASDEMDTWFRSLVSISHIPEFTLSFDDFHAILADKKTLAQFAEFRSGVEKDPSLIMAAAVINRL